jgi:hypothetical protein
LSNHHITPIASAQINHDHLKIELVEPDSMPAAVRIVWPAATTVVDPEPVPRRCGGRRPGVCSGAHCARCNPGRAAILTARADRASRALSRVPLIGPPLRPAKGIADITASMVRVTARAHAGLVALHKKGR